MDEAATTQQTGQGPPADQEAAAVDLLSGLCDDVLVRILGLAAHARDAVRTGALSRRWRGLWRRVPALRFDSERWFEHGGSARGFMAFVDDTLALRARSGDGGGLEQLEILLLRWDGGKGKQQLVPPPSVGIIGAAERWIWHAMRHGVKSFHFELELPDRGDAEETHVMALDELPSSAKLEAMYLYLSHATVRLPATVAFASLTDLTLEGLQVAGDDVVLLARLASAACCPVLHKLHMGFITLVGEQKLVLDAGELTELSLADVDGMGSLELTTPSLRVLRIDGCKELESLAASATPRLEKLACQRNHHLLSIDRELPSVSRLKVDLYAYSGYRSIKLLQNCSSATCLSLELHHSTIASYDTDIIKGRIPQLDHVRSLKARIFPALGQQNLHHPFGDYVASLLTSFKNLRYLRLHLVCFHIKKSPVSKSNFACDHWKTHEKISFVHLMEAEFRRVTGTGCELRFLQYVLSGTTQLQKVILGFNQEYPLEIGCKEFCHMLLGSGTWTEHHDTCHRLYEWRPCR